MSGEPEDNRTPLRRAAEQLHEAKHRAVPADALLLNHPGDGRHYPWQPEDESLENFRDRCFANLTRYFIALEERIILVELSLEGDTAKVGSSQFLPGAKLDG